MDDLQDILIAVVIVALVVIAAVFCSAAYSLGYERGQIDAANGIQRYHLVEQTDGSTRWERKKETP